MWKSYLFVLTAHYFFFVPLVGLIFLQTTLWALDAPKTPLHYLIVYSHAFTQLEETIFDYHTFFIYFFSFREVSAGFCLQLVASLISPEPLIARQQLIYSTWGALLLNFTNRSHCTIYCRYLSHLFNGIENNFDMSLSRCRRSGLLR